ncbi:hypothetical protein BHE90_017226 [Fusarium euwallaceae]|uniref:NACHT domain-containing protein n=1 Tax=Fusarium euwallaceae TaxID=1147111 RepID=A0A430KY45_9HYPO|nr:hypothetical protein BHE90_017226 [Fusarium euwallaceae]
MKYLRTHKETKGKLQEWAQEDRLVLGLLRGLIYQILRQCPELIQQIYPEVGHLPRYGRLGDDGDENFLIPSPPTSVPGLLAILRNACDLLISSHARLCFFIDGLDEYEGKPSDIIELIGVLRSMPNVKICASSRPWNEFEHSFGQGGSQKLYMQELTKNDIRNYEKDEQGAELIHEIIEAARGVFLWVVLVVRSFQEGLTNGDRIVDLQKRLRHLPRDLNEYFEKILLSDVAEFYRPQSARIFTATLKAQERLPLMAYWYMDQEDPKYAFGLDVGPLSLQKTNLRLKQTRKRLNACCKGLLEVHFLSKDGVLDMLPSSILFGWKVDFLHRTVKDFLVNPETEAFLSCWSPQQNLDVDMSICSALLSLIKTVPQEREYFELSGGVPALLHLFFLHSRALNDNPDCEVTSLARLLDNLDATLIGHDQEIGQHVYSNALYALLTQEGFAESCGLMKYHVQFLHVCVRFGLSRYVDKKLNSSSLTCEAATARVRILLRLALRDTDHVMVRLLLRKGTDPNASVKGGTNWTLFLNDIHTKWGPSVHSKPNESGLYHCVQDLLEHGADPKAEICVGPVTLSAHNVLQGTLVPEHMALIEYFFTDPVGASHIAPKVSIPEDSQDMTKEDVGVKEQKRQRSNIRQMIVAKLERLGHQSG